MLQTINSVHHSHKWTVR